VTLYSTMGAEEDKAEVFAGMMMRFDWPATDSVLRAKVALMKDRLESACDWVLE
jgi:hypothetical protein